MIPKFNIGDKVFMATYDRRETSIVCPDCGGTKKIKVTLHDESEWMISCNACDRGFMGSKGTIIQYEWTTVAKDYTVTGIRATTAEITYELDNFGGGSYFVPNEKDVFATLDEAKANGEIMRAQHEADENKRYRHKEKDTRSWAFNINYHRQCIKRAERDLIYHRGKIEICKPHIKDEREQKKVPA